MNSPTQPNSNNSGNAGDIPETPPWPSVQPTRAELERIRNGFPEILVTDPMQALELREIELPNRVTRSSRYLHARQNAGEWLAVHLNARGISVGTLDTLRNLERSIGIATQIAEGKEINGRKPTIDEMVKAAAAVAIGSKAYGELAEKLIKQLDPVKPKEEQPQGNRAPSREAPVIPIQANSVYIQGPNTATTGNDKRPEVAAVPAK